MNVFTKIIAAELGLQERSVDNTLELLEQNCTVPFISRYRKERTGNLDEVSVGDISMWRDRLTEMTKRKTTVISTIDALGKLTDELRSRIESCWNLQELEDIYMPYKPRRRTKADVAREQGLEPLAQLILLQRDSNPLASARRFVRGEVSSTEQAVEGAKCIIAEVVSEDERVRKSVRGVFRRESLIVSKVVKSKAGIDEALKYSDYFDFSEPLRRCSSHRMLAMCRGAKEGFLRLSVAVDDEVCVGKIRQFYVKGRGECGKYVAEAVADSYKRLVRPSIETEFMQAAKLSADNEAINVFSENLRQLLLASPLGQKRVMGIDPGFRTGCKLVCLSEQGDLLYKAVIFPNAPKNDWKHASAEVCNAVERLHVEAIAVGNGTASRETGAFLKSLDFGREVPVYVVSEDGASVYSASDVAREEFPLEDVTVRGAVSIGRRLMDPLAELVKINPQSIGVGQYQHDVDQQQLKQSLDMVVSSCVNTVGVNLNTVSKQLLMYVSGLNVTSAQNIVDYRKKNGAFKSRAELKKVARIGPVVYQQCAGFLRIPNAENPLDNSAVHPESYGIVKQMAADRHCKVSDLISNTEVLDSINLNDYMSEAVGLPTLQDIVSELKQPGRDPREQLDTFEFDSRVSTVDDLVVGMVLPGIVTNITGFGAFVDVGVHQDGLVHISQLANRFVADATKVVRLHQHVMVKVVDVDRKRNRISLSMKDVE